MSLEVGQVISDFEVTGASEVREHEGTAYEMRHRTSAAKLIWLANADKELSFSISFSTPAADDSGVFHILEHSMLCGSKRYPVKEPFTAMLKTSMQTFLNAFTGADYTMYPVATANEQDLLNLMDVYMDAVLNPLLVDDPNIFKQEGWHYSCKGDAASLGISGVVYNEMKGALSVPVRRALDACRRVLFEGGTYGWNSGGDPSCIPGLDYEAFIDAYRRHYRLDNAIITLYGDLDIDAVLGQLETRHIQPWLSSHKAKDFHGAPNALVCAKPRLALGGVERFKGGAESAMLAFGSVLGGGFDVFRTTAAGVLCDALFGAVEAPVRKVLLESGICGDVAACNMSVGCQSHVFVAALGALEKDRAVFIDLLRKGCEDVLVSASLIELVDATVSLLEFSWREGASQPAGITFAQDVRSCWPYGPDPLASTCYEDFLAWHAEARLDGTYESLLRELFVDYNHAACVALVPDADFDAFGEQAHLDALASGLSSADVQEITRQEAELSRLRTAPDSPQALAALPRLDRGDLPAKPTRPKTQEEELLGTGVVRMLEPTHGIDYVDYYFDLHGLELEDMQFLSFLCALAGELPCAGMDASQVQVAMKNTLGEADCDVMSMTRWDDGKPLALLHLGFSALSGKAPAAHKLFWELFEQSDFSCEDKVAQIIDLSVLSFEQLAARKAGMLALRAARLPLSGAALVDDAVAGLAGYRFFKGLQAQGDMSSVCERLEHLRSWLLSRRPSLVCFAGGDEGYKLACESSPCMGVAARALPLAPCELALPAASKTGYALPTNVAANAAVLCPPALRKVDGCDPLVEQGLDWDYLWDAVRVKGGAYGCNCAISQNGDLNLVSVSDPRIDGTLEDFYASTEWLVGHEFAPEEVDGFVISCIAKADKPRKVADKLASWAKNYLIGYPAQERDKKRAEVLAATPQVLHETCERFASYRPASAASFASREMLEGSSIIEQNSDLFE